MTRLGFLLALAVLGCAPQALAQPPDEPRVLDDIPELGKPGGELRTLVGRARDTRLLYVFGHARLVGYDLELNLVPDILASYETEAGRVFTLHIRRGHRWSDGHPFTAEDFRFWWEDVANNRTLQPSGPVVQLLAGCLRSRPPLRSRSIGPPIT